MSDHSLLFSSSQPGHRSDAPPKIHSLTRQSNLDGTYRTRYGGGAVHRRYRDRWLRAQEAENESIVERKTSVTSSPPSSTRPPSLAHALVATKLTMFPMFPDTAMAGGHMPALLAILVQAGRHGERAMWAGIRRGGLAICEGKAAWHNRDSRSNAKHRRKIDHAAPSDGYWVLTVAAGTYTGAGSIRSIRSIRLVRGSPVALYSALLTPV
jgi:hypothetical protein